jgi:hypothetical protein
MFNWNDDFDVLTGKREFEFRILKKAPVMASKQISEKWQKLYV